MTQPAAARPPETAPPAAASFARGLFVGAVHDDLLFPFPEPLAPDSDESRTVRRLLAALKELAAQRVLDSQRFDDEEAIGDDVIAALAGEGFLALTIPKEYGGLGLSTAAYARVFSGVSAIDGSVAVLIGVHCGLGAKAIALYGTEEQKSRYLPPLARGETLAAYALTEPEVGSDAQNIKARAEPDGDGSWRLSGRKIWIGNGHRAGVIVTFAQTQVLRAGGVAARPTAFIVRPDMPGFHVVGTVRKLGIRGSTQAELLFEDVPVPADHVLGQLGKGFAVAVHVLNAGRITLTAGCAGASRRILREMQGYASRRIQFGKPLTDFEITQRKISSTAADLFAVEAMLGLLAAMVERETAEYALETACAKVFASEAVWRAADELVQIAGGRGFVKPFPYEQILRDARINRIFEGANEVLRLFIALNGVEGPAQRLREVGVALRRPVRNLGLITGYAAARVRSVFGATSTLDVELHPRLEEHKRYFEKHVGELAAAVDRALLRHRRDIIDRQLVLERLASMAIELFARASVLSRTQAELTRQGEDRAESILALCDLFCIDSGRRFRSARQGLDARDDEIDERRRFVAYAVGAAGGAYVSDPILEE